jgi:gluconate 5-dehydrogenase
MSVLDQFRLNGKVALVTGAGSGLGAAFAEAMAEAGAAVACVDLNEDTARETAARLASEGWDTLALQADVRSEDDVRRVMEAARDGLGGLDIVFANAGIGGRGGMITEMTKENWQETIDINLTGVFLTVREAARLMIPQGYGKIINTASIYGLTGPYRSGAYAYAAAKAGVVNLTRLAGSQLAAHGIRVNAIAPGFFRTPIGGGRLGFSEAEEDRRRRDELMKQVPMGRMGEPPELKGVAVFLASPASDFMTGYTVAVDGGYMTW